MPDNLNLTTQQVLAAARRLSLADRVDLFIALRDDLCNEMWDATAPGASVDPLTRQQLDEVDRRLARRERDTDPAASWESIDAALKSPYGEQ